MKKGIIIFTAIIALGTVVGCGKKKNQIVCTGKSTENGQTYEAKIIANLKDGKVSGGSMEMKFSDKKTAETMCGLMSLANSMAEDGKKLDYKCSGKTLKINSLETFDTEGNLIGLTREEFIKQATEGSSDIKCK